jgi:cell division protein FtsB
MQAMPVSGPYEPQPGAPQSGGRTAITVLSVLLGLFVLTSVTLGGLYVRQGQETTQRSAQIAALQAENETLQRQLNAAQRDLRGADDDLATTQIERDAIADCMNAIYDWWDALDEAGGVDTAETEAVWLEASRLCRVAEPYL